MNEAYAHNIRFDYGRTYGSMVTAYSTKSYICKIRKKMNSQADIIALADAKFKEAECLCNNNFYDGAFYLAGYTVELLLKAKVCKTLGIPDFFLFDTKKAKPETYKPFKAHDYSQLLILSGVYTAFDDELNNNILFKAHWSIVSSWNEGSRYLTGKTEAEVKSFLTSVQEVSTWIKNHL